MMAGDALSKPCRSDILWVDRLLQSAVGRFLLSKKKVEYLCI